MKYVFLNFAIILAAFAARYALPDRIWYSFNSWLVGATLPASIIGGCFLYRAQKLADEKQRNAKSMANYFFYTAFVSAVLGFFVMLAGAVKAWPN